MPLNNDATCDHHKQSDPEESPQTVDDAADQIINELGPEEREELANLKSSGVKTLQMVLGLYTEEQLDNFNIGDNPQDLDDGYASANIIRRVCEKLQVVK